MRQAFTIHSDRIGPDADDYDMNRYEALIDSEILEQYGSLAVFVYVTDLPLSYPEYRRGQDEELDAVIDRAWVRFCDGENPSDELSDEDDDLLHNN